MTRRANRLLRIRENACRRHACQARSWRDIFRGPFADVAVFAMPTGRQRQRLADRAGDVAGPFRFTHVGDDA